MSRQRISWIDICRGIGILLVMYGHGLTNDTERYLIYGFHMPLFFFLSGIVFRPQQATHFLQFMQKSTRTILFPYVLFATLTFVLWFLHATTPSLREILWQFYGIFYGNGNNGFLGFNVALWFLPCLFVTRMLFGLLSRWTEKVRFLIPVLIVCSLIGYALSVFFPLIKLPFGIETAFTAITFFGAGYLWMKNKNVMHHMMQRKVVLFAATLVLYIIVASIGYVLSGHQVDMRMNRLNEYIPFYLGAFSGIFMVLMLGMMIRKNRVLEYIGRQSLVLFACHYLLFTYFNDMMRLIAYDDLRMLKLFLPSIYTSLSLVIILLCMSLLRRVKVVYLVSKLRGKR